MKWEREVVESEEEEKEGRCSQKPGRLPISSLSNDDRGVEQGSAFAAVRSTGCALDRTDLARAERTGLRAGSSAAARWSFAFFCLLREDPRMGARADGLLRPLANAHVRKPTAPASW